MKITNWIKQRLMAFRDMFKDDNDINEKSVVGFAAFAMIFSRLSSSSKSDFSLVH